jgi:hypothetical protein
MSKPVTLTVVTVSAFDEVRLRETLASFPDDLLSVEYLVITPKDDIKTKRLVDSLNIQRNLQARISHDEGNGVYAAMNLGIEQAFGEFIVFWNSGDTCESHDEFKKFITFLTDSDDAWGVFNAKFPWREPMDLSKRNLRRFVLQTGGYISHQTVYARKSLLLELGGFDESFLVAADTKLISQLWLRREFTLYDKNLVCVENPGLSGRLNRVGRLENFRIILTVLPIRYIVRSIASAIWRENGYLARKIVRAYRENR